MTQEKVIFENYLRNRGLKLTSQRFIILDVFLKEQKHLTVENLYELVKRRDPSIGQTTIFRTLKLLCQSDIAQEADFGDKRIRYEIKFGHEHHDHLVCVKCGEFIEAMDEKIEDLQMKLCKKFKFKPLRHRLEIFGICNKCSKRRR